MGTFAPKPLSRVATLGERLREAREESRQTIAAAADATGVPEHHLTAIEAGAYASLPGDVYTRNFLRRYARFLGFNEERVLESYEAERRVLQPRERQLPRSTGLPASVTITILARRTIIVIAILAILGYLGWEIGKILAPPTLSLESPAASGLTSEQTLEVRGQTDPEAAVTINGQAVLVNEEGRFAEVVTLTVGRNTIVIRAAKKRGQQSTVTREIIFQETAPPPSGEEATPPSGEG